MLAPSYQLLAHDQLVQEYQLLEHDHSQVIADQPNIDLFSSLYVLEETLYIGQLLQLLSPAASGQLQKEGRTF